MRSASDADRDHQLPLIGLQGAEATGEQAEITEGSDEEMEPMRRVEQRDAEFAARRASELAQRTGPPDQP